MEKYTQEQWSADNSFGAKIGQEIEEEIYNNFYNVPRLGLPLQKSQDFKTTIVCGFMISEPYAHADSSDGKCRAFYAAFGKDCFNKCFFLGYQNAIADIYDDNEDNENDDDNEDDDDYDNLFYDEDGNWDPVEDLYGRTTDDPNFGSDKSDDEIEED